MIAINSKVSYRFKVRVSEKSFGKAWVQQVWPVHRNQKFFLRLTLKEKISRKGHFLTIQTNINLSMFGAQFLFKKENIFDERCVFNFFSRDSLSREGDNY